jgi:hypothetical protein
MEFFKTTKVCPQQTEISKEGGKEQKIKTLTGLSTTTSGSKTKLSQPVEPLAEHRRSGIPTKSTVH